MLDLNGPWGWLNLESKSKVEDIINKLKNYERLSWGEIEKSNQNHLIPLDRISKEARERLGEMQLYDLDSLFSFRLSGKERIWGWRYLGLFYIIWWDPEHKVYPVSKRHT